MDKQYIEYTKEISNKRSYDIDMCRLGIFSREELIDQTVEQKLLQKYKMEVCQYDTEESLMTPLSNYEYECDVLLIDVRDYREALKLAQDVLKKNSCIKLIFVIDELEHISDFFEVQPVYILNRSFHTSQLFDAIEKALEQVCDVQKSLLQIGYKGRLLRIPFQEIFYIESDKRYSILHMEQEQQRVLMKLSEVLQLLPKCFVRCHQSFIINLNKIRSYERNKVVLENGEKITVSRSREEDMKQVVLNYFGSMLG